MNAYLNVVALGVPVLGLVVAFHIDMNSPFALVPVLAVFASAFFAMGFTARDVNDAAERKAGEMMEEAASGAVEEKMAELELALVIASPRHGGRQEKDTETERSRRLVPMHPRFAEWLDGQEGGGPFIVGADGGRISPSTAQKRWRRFLSDNPEAPPVTIENMRHSFATSYLAAGGRVEALSKILGHTDAATTLRRYVRPDSDSIAADAARVFG